MLRTVPAVAVLIRLTTAVLFTTCLRFQMRHPVVKTLPRVICQTRSLLGAPRRSSHPMRENLEALQRLFLERVISPLRPVLHPR